MVRAAVVLSSMMAACAPALPVAIKEEIATTQRVEPGATTIVFFTDFQCPYCRRTHAALAPLLDGSHGPVRLVLKQVPLAHHPDAKTAARAAVCFERVVAARAAPAAAGAPARPDVLYDEYAAALFSSDDLSEATCERLAEEHGVARDALERCLHDPSTDVRIEQDVALFDSVHGDGVPLLFVGNERLEGAQSRDRLASAIDVARAGGAP